MYCKKCGKNTPDGSVFCSQCGQRFEFPSNVPPEQLRVETQATPRTAPSTEAPAKPGNVSNAQPSSKEKAKKSMIVFGWAMVALVVLCVLNVIFKKNIFLLILVGFSALTVAISLALAIGYKTGVHQKEEEKTRAAAKKPKFSLPPTINKILSAFVSVLGIFLIFAFVLPSFGVKNPISNWVAELSSDALNSGKGTSELEVLVDAYLLSLKNSSMTPLEKYLDENMDYSISEKQIRESNFTNIDISTAKYSIVREYTVNDIECVEIDFDVYGEGIAIGKLTNAITGTMYAHKAGSKDLWFYGAFAE